MEIKDIDLHRVVSTAVIHKDGRFLITRRSLEKKAFPGKWTVPGGGLELTDYIDTPPTVKGSNSWYRVLESNLRREVLEEVGLEMGKVDYLLDVVFVRPDNIPVLTLSFYAPWKSGEVKLNDENIDFAWIRIEEVKKYDLISGIGEEIVMVDKILKGENPLTVKIAG
jgi:8-oxo-dGTP pyrophosphatase MutT (NUDIX family)